MRLLGLEIALRRFYVRALAGNTWQTKDANDAAASLIHVQLSDEFFVLAEYSQREQILEQKYSTGIASSIYL